MSAGPPRPIAEVNAELDALNAEFLAAAERYVDERSVEAFQAWQRVQRRYQAVHREWFALAMPGSDYDATFGGPEMVSVAVPVDDATKGPS